MMVRERRIGIAGACVGLILIAVGTTQTLSDPRLTRETIVSSGLTLPIMIAWLNPTDPNDFFVIEKQTGSSTPRIGTVRRVTNGVISPPLLTFEVSSLNWEHGLLGMELHPDFDQNGYVYFYYTEPDPASPEAILTARLVRYRFDGNQFLDRTEIWSIPIGNVRIHFGGVIRFGPDGKLYLIVGDFHQFARDVIEVNRSVSGVLGAGGIYRLNDDGSIPSDNPFAYHPDPRIRALYAYGIRNSFGLAFDARTGWLWFTENGPDCYDEINLARPGLNSGWVKIMGPDDRNATYFENGRTAYDANQLIMLPNAYYSDPAFSWRTPIGVAAMCFLHSARFDPDLRDQCVVGESVNSRLYLFQMNATRNGFVFTDPNLQDRVADTADERNHNSWGTGWGVASDLRIGPDGYLYVVSHLAHRIHRIRPVNPPEIVNGQVVLFGYQGTRLGVPLTLTLRKANQTYVINTTLDAFGRFSERVPEAGQYTVIAKAGNYLSLKQSGVTINPQGFAYLKLRFERAGDVNNDNVIDEADLLTVLFAFGGNNHSADVNGDGTVDDADLLTILFNFGSQGDS